MLGAEFQISEPTAAPALAPSRQAPWSARRRSTVVAQGTSPWRSWRAAAYRRKIDVGIPPPASQARGDGRRQEARPLSACRFPSRRAMQRQWLPDLNADAQGRIEGAQSILGNVGNPIPANGSALPLCLVKKGLAPQQDASGLDARAPRQHTERGQRSQRLSAT